MLNIKITSRRSAFLPIMGALLIATLLIGWVISYSLYKSAIEENKENLMHLASNLSSLISSIAGFDQKYIGEDFQGDASDATLRQVRKALSLPFGAGTTEALIFRAVEGGVEMLVHIEGDYHQDYYPDDTELGALAIQTLDGESGVVHLQDPDGQDLLIAYKPIELTNWGIFVERYESEIWHPFLWSSIQAFMVSIVVILLMAWGILWITQQISKDALESERKQVELTNSLLRTQQIGKLGNWHLNLKTDHLQWSDQVFEIFDMNPADFDHTVEMFFQRVHPDDVELIRQESRKAIDQGGEYTVDHRLIIRNGSVRYVRENAEIEKDKDGKPIAMLGTVIDITDIRAKQMELERIEAQLRLAINSALIGLVVSNVEGEILTFNDTASQIFGYSPEEIIGSNVSVLANSDDAKRHHHYLANYLSTGEAQIIGKGREVIGKRKNGDDFPLRLGIAPLKLDDELHFIASIEDLSEQKQLESQLRQAQKMDVVGQMVGGIAHDFNNLLGIAMGNLELINMALTDQPEITRKSERALNAIKRGAGLTAKLLGFSRQNLKVGTTANIDEAIDQVSDLIKRSLTSSIEVIVDVADDLPDVNADQGDLEDAIVNLSLNARDAMPDGGQLAIKSTFVHSDEVVIPDMETSDELGFVAVSIADTGTGMDDETLEKIFEPFFTTKESGVGTGLGLSMVYGFVKRAGGGIDVHTKLGQGTNITLYLPISMTESSNKFSEDEPPIKLKFKEVSKILVVDDEPDLLKLVKTVLSSEGHQVLISSDGNEALEIFEKHKDIDIVLSDVIMPGHMSGYELAQTVREARPDIKFCFMSGYTGRSNPIKEEYSDMPLLRKPFTINVLLKFVSKQLNQH
ncbi:PAS domain S-box protein [Curvivirga aplysinae]|uniref:PAS domain S-box protein n=1 Tax=Curvivirga aplysinae TaxID=2529852 RepID=UPI0012BD78FC|nr:PAS domain S-box protein [Curvivirga aplysinae]MTI10496.1 PAS domain S-box protein [Curvivirga aplysinae]